MVFKGCAFNTYNSIIYNSYFFLKKLQFLFYKILITDKKYFRSILLWKQNNELEKITLKLVKILYELNTRMLLVLLN